MAKTRKRRAFSLTLELLMKSREAALAAVQIFNSPVITFKSEPDDFSVVRSFSEQFSWGDLPPMQQVHKMQQFTWANAGRRTVSGREIVGYLAAGAVEPRKASNY